MKKLCFAILLLLTYTFVFAYTIVSQDIKSNTWWTSATIFTLYHTLLQHGKNDIAPIRGVIDNSRSFESEKIAVIKAPTTTSIANFPNLFNLSTCVSLDMPAAGHGTGRTRAVMMYHMGFT